MTTALVACRPVDITGLPTDIPIPDPHKGSTVSKCQVCGQDIWLGPGQMDLVSEKVKKQGIDAILVTCFLCAIMLARSVPGETTVEALTNKTTPRRHPLTGEIVKETP